MSLTSESCRITHATLSRKTLKPRRKLFRVDGASGAELVFMSTREVSLAVFKRCGGSCYRGRRFFSNLFFSANAHTRRRQTRHDLGGDGNVTPAAATARSGLGLVVVIVSV